jgi:hypothetical protein
MNAEEQPLRPDVVKDITKKQIETYTKPKNKNKNTPYPPISAKEAENFPNSPKILIKKIAFRTTNTRIKTALLSFDTTRTAQKTTPPTTLRCC